MAKGNSTTRTKFNGKNGNGKAVQLTQREDYWSALTVLQKGFVKAYLENRGNATQAYIDGGGSPKGAESSGPRMLRNVRVLRAIEEGFAERGITRESLGLIIDKLLHAMDRTAVAEFVLGDLTAEEMIEALGEDGVRGIQSIKVEYHPNGSLKSKSITMVSIVDLIRVAARLYGHLQDKVEHEVHGIIDLDVSTMTDDELMRLAHTLDADKELAALKRKRQKTLPAPQGTGS